VLRVNENGERHYRMMKNDEKFRFWREGLERDLALRNYIAER